MSKSNKKKSWKEIIANYIQENAEYFDCVSGLLSGVEYIPYRKD